MKSIGIGLPFAALLPEFTCSRKFIRNVFAFGRPGLVDAGPPTLAPGSAARTPATA